FSVSNFRSFSTEETFSLVASKRLAARHDTHLVSIPDSNEKVLRAAVLYGANGAGKSNLFKAIRYLKSIVVPTRSYSYGTGCSRFRFTADSEQPSTFDLQFIAEEKLYRFGCKIDDRRIIEEWLVQVVGGREKAIYERITDSNGRVTVDAEGLKSSGEKLRALATVGGPQNQSFLATVRATLDPSEIGDPLSAILSWFRDSLSLVGPDEALGPLGFLLSRDSDLLNFAGEFLKSSSTGVDHLEVAKNQISEEDLRTALPADVVSRLLQRTLDDGKDTATIVRSDGDEFTVDLRGEKRHHHIRVQAAHKNQAEEVVALSLSQESDGTRRLLNLIPALHELKTKNAVYFIDEMDRSLHPILVWNFLDFFLKSCAGGQRQIIVTTHESNLLDLDLLRRDEIWFAEKDGGGATRLYSMMDFKVRNDLEIRKHYLQGRFGAVPFLGNLDRLLAEENGQA
ncbi:MAG TPA: ATP-binding protein, partial [Bryobacteraceae bacterium]|nr:ATP-binding protein [Bryobacteraceae bacterium]